MLCLIKKKTDCWEEAYGNVVSKVEGHIRSDNRSCKDQIVQPFTARICAEASKYSKCILAKMDSATKPWLEGLKPPNLGSKA